MDTKKVIVVFIISTIIFFLINVVFALEDDKTQPPYTQLPLNLQDFVDKITEATKQKTQLKLDGFDINIIKDYFRQVLNVPAEIDTGNGLSTDSGIIKFEGPSGAGHPKFKSEIKLADVSNFKVSSGAFSLDDKFGNWVRDSFGLNYVDHNTFSANSAQSIKYKSTTATNVQNYEVNQGVITATSAESFSVAGTAAGCTNCRDITFSGDVFNIAKQEIN